MSHLISSGSNQTPPKDETAPGPGNGLPARLDNSQQPTFAAPQLTICWSANLKPQIKNSFKIVSFIGRSSGKSFQLAFHGSNFMVVQPSEGQPVVASS